MSALPRRKHLEVLTNLVSLAEKSALDIGCGDGSLLRALLRRGLQEAVGLEPAPQQLQRATAGEPLPNLRFLPGGGEALDFPAESFDLVIFFNSLHHLPVEVMDQALREAGRVLREDGCLYIAEPLAEGAHFDLMRPVDDETEVRRVAYERLSAAAGGPFEQLTELRYDAPVRYVDYNAFRRQIEAVDPERTALFERFDERLRQDFEELGEKDETGYLFSQPMRVNLLQPRRSSPL